VINSAAMFADTDMSVKGKQNLLRCTHLTEISLARAYRAIPTYVLGKSLVDLLQLWQ